MSSNIKPFKHLMFCRVVVRKGGSFCERVRLNFQADASSDIKMNVA